MGSKIYCQTSQWDPIESWIQYCSKSRDLGSYIRLWDPWTQTRPLSTDISYWIHQTHLRTDIHSSHGPVRLQRPVLGAPETMTTV